MTPPHNDHTLANRLRVVAIRHPTVPLAEIRLHFDVPRLDAAHAARMTLLAACLLADDVSRAHPTPALELARLGAELTATADPHGLIVRGSCPRSALNSVLRLLASVLRTGAPPVTAVARERDRLVRQLNLAERHPYVVVRTALFRHVLGAHPLTIQLASPADLAQVTSTDVASLWRETVVPGRARLLVLGDIAVGEVTAAADAAFGAWTGQTGDRQRTPMLPMRPVTGNHLSRVSDVRLRRAHLSLCANGVVAADRRYPALFLAGNILAGLATSRVARSIRHRAGLVYTVRCHYEPMPGTSLVHVATDTAPELADEVLAKIYDELARMSTDPPTGTEIDASRACAMGACVTRLAPQAALADAVADDLRWHHPPTETFRFMSRLGEVTTQQVVSAAAEFLHPGRFTGVLVGPVS